MNMNTLAFRLRLGIALPLAILSCFLLSMIPGRIATEKKAPCYSCTINGTTCGIVPGQAYFYNLSSGCTTVSWMCSCGTIVHYTSTSVQIVFNTCPGWIDIETVGGVGGGADLKVKESTCP
jgi:hypothetical protein